MPSAAVDVNCLDDIGVVAGCVVPVENKCLHCVGAPDECRDAIEVVGWEVFDADVRAAAVTPLELAFGVDVVGWEVLDANVRAAAVTPRVELACARHWFATLLVEGKTNELWKELEKDTKSDISPVGLWRNMCGALSNGDFENDRPDDPRVSACVVAAFVRAGLILQPPRKNRFDFLVPSPFYLAVIARPSFAIAMLDLPVAYGINVNCTSGIDLDPEEEEHVPAIGHMSIYGRWSAILFDRLLRRTHRSVVSAGLVDVERGCEQHGPRAHILIANILLLGYVSGSGGLAHTVPRLGELVRVFASQAQPDGDGTDLTGGRVMIAAVGESARRRDPRADTRGPPVADLWPNGRFRGPLALINVFRHYYRSEPQVLAILDQAASDLVLALRSIRTYRRTIHPSVAVPFIDGSIYARDLHALVISYLLVPLEDESQLEHPQILLPPPHILLPPPPPTSCPGTRLANSN
jgi:hypothetical protein